jgi:hypothetical protein
MDLLDGSLNERMSDAKSCCGEFVTDWAIHQTGVVGKEAGCQRSKVILGNDSRTLLRARIVNLLHFYTYIHGKTYSIKRE